MTCSVCLTSTPALQTVTAQGYCPRCGTDYRAWAHRPRPILDPHADYNNRTRKLISTGAAHRDRLVAARLALRSTL